MVAIQKYSQVWLWNAEAAFVSILFILGIGIIWNLNLSSPVHHEKSGFVISDTPTPDEKSVHVISNPLALKIFQKRQLKEAIEQNIAIPMFIPTGISIQALDFLDKHNVKITGYVWQKYLKDIHNDLTDRGIIFRDAVTIKMEHSPQIIWNTTKRKKLFKNL